MPSLRVIRPARRVRRLPSSSVCALIVALGATAESHAQAPAPPPAAAPPPPAAAPPPPAAAPPPPPASAGDIAELRAALEAQRAEIDALKQQAKQAEGQQAVIDELKVTQDAAAEAAAAQPVDPLRIYGFADFGWQTTRARENSILPSLFDNINSSGYVIGNLNFYFDAQPVENWRALVEIRFTNAPHGTIGSYGGLAGTFQRNTTEQFDPHATAVNGPMWGGYTVIERAFAEWTRLQYLNVRVGSWFTPFGIWNEDHGSPTLIAMALPQFLLQKFVPVRQTGLQLKGSVFFDEWQLGYVATVSNGRQELANYNLNDRMAFGGRAFLRREGGRINATVGASFYQGHVEDRVVDVVSVNPIAFDSHTSYEYDEWAVGLDLALDVDATRVRSEALMRRIQYEPGKRKPATPLDGPGALWPDSYQSSVYLLVANQLPWAGIEPYLSTELFQMPHRVGDGIFVGSVGLNVHFNPAITWKSQLSQAWFFDWLEKAPQDPSINDGITFFTRLVVAF
jgi:hypothetical protein